MKTQLARIALLACFFVPAAHAQPANAPAISGRWISSERVTFTNPALAGSAFHLDIVIAADGSFQGSWDSYQCYSYPGAYGTSIISCSRVKQPAKARGRFDRMGRRGEIDLEKLGKSSFSYTLGKELQLDLPKAWQKRGDAVLYTTKLTPAAR